MCRQRHWNTGFFHISITVCVIIVVEVVKIDQVNHMIRCGQMVCTQVSTFLHNYWVGYVIFLIVLYVEIPGSYGIIILLPPPPPPHPPHP